MSFLATARFRTSDSFGFAEDGRAMALEGNNETNTLEQYWEENL